MYTENADPISEDKADYFLSDRPRNNEIVSVIIPTRNSGQTIAQCLQSIASQSYKPIEVIVVDSYSTDLTKDIASDFGAIVHVHHGERSLAKNLGAKVAKGKYLYFVDSDHHLASGVIEACVSSIGGVDGVLTLDQDVTRDSWISRSIASRRRILSNDPLNVAIRFVKRDVFDRLGGFDPELYAGEDLDFHRRFLLHGFKMTNSTVSELHLGSPSNLRGLLDRSLYYSANYLTYFEKNPLASLKRVSPLLIVEAWKNTDTRGSELLAVVFLGILSNAFLGIGILLRLSTSRLGRRRNAV